MQWQRFLEVVAALNKQGVDYVVVGAVALGLHGHPRGTRDLDLFVRPAPANIARLRLALAYGPPDDSLPLDILTRLGDAIAFDDLKSEEVTVDGHKVRVATPATLFRMKRDTVRPQDRADAAWLRERFGLEEDA